MPTNSYSDADARVRGEVKMNREQRHFPDYPKHRARDAGDFAGASLVISRLVSKGKRLYVQCYYVVTRRRATTFSGYLLGQGTVPSHAAMRKNQESGEGGPPKKRPRKGPARGRSKCDTRLSASCDRRCSQRESPPYARASSFSRCGCAAAVGRSGRVPAHHFPARPPARRGWRSPNS